MSDSGLNSASYIQISSMTHVFGLTELLLCSPFLGYACIFVHAYISLLCHYS